MYGENGKPFTGDRMGLRSSTLEAAALDGGSAPAELPLEISLNGSMSVGAESAAGGGSPPEAQPLRACPAQAAGKAAHRVAVTRILIKMRSEIEGRVKITFTC